MHAIVADQRGGGNLPAASGEDEIECEPRFAGSRWPADQNRAVRHQHGGGVDGGLRGHGAGSRTTKRAPATVFSPWALTGPGRFSAQMRPRCASMICFEIDRPNPEFWPKP